MNPRSAPATHEYQKINIQHEVETASPHRLVQLLMERTLTKIALAIEHMERNDIGEKGAMIGSAISIISGLKASLNHDTDAQIAGNFDAVYDYMIGRLLEANLTDKPELLREVSGLMREIKEAWDAIADHPDVLQDAGTTG